MKKLIYIYTILSFSMLINHSCKKEDLVDKFLLRSTEVAYANEIFSWQLIEDAYSYECSVDDEKSTITTSENTLDVSKLHETYPTLLAGKHMFNVRARYGNFLSMPGIVEFDYNPDATIFVVPADDQNYSEMYTEFNSVTFNVKGYNVVSGKWIIAKSSDVTGDEGEYAMVNGVDFTETQLAEINNNELSLNSGQLFDTSAEYKLCIVVYSNTGTPVAESASQTPSESGLIYKRVDISFTDIENEGSHIAWIDGSLVANIPVGVNVFFETTSESFTMMDITTYAPFANGNVINGTAMVEWTEEIALAAANGFIISTSTSCTSLYYIEVSGSETEYKQVDISFSSVSYGESKMAWIDASAAKTIPVGVTVYFKSTSSNYSLSDIVTYTPFGSGSLSAGIGAIEWTEEIAAAAANGFMISLEAECTALYYKEALNEPQYDQVNISFSGMEYGESKIAWIGASDAASIPVGVTLYFESVSENYTLMDNQTYTTFATGSLTSGVGEVEWTEEIAAAAANGFMIYLETDCTALYYLQLH